MWGFLTKMLDEAGLVAVMYSVTCIGFSIAVRTLFEANERLQEELQQLQDQRLEDAKAFSKEMTAHTRSIDDSISKLSRSLDVMIDVIGGRRGGMR